MKKIALLGYSGHAYVVADTILNNQNIIVGYYDVKEASVNPYQIIYLGEEKNIKPTDSYAYFPAVGSNELRKTMVEFLEDNNLQTAIIIHPTAKLSNKCSIQPASFISGNAVINAMSSIGKGCIINTGAIVEHECSIGDFSHIAPGAVLAGNVTVIPPDEVSIAYLPALTAVKSESYTT